MPEPDALSGGPERPRSFGTVMTCTPSYLRYALACACSVREHNREIPIELFVERSTPALERAARSLNVTVRVLDPADEVSDHAPAASTEHIRSRLLKIQAIAQVSFDQFVYLDADTLALDDIATVQALRSAHRGDGFDIFMLLRRPVLPTLWDYGRLNFTDNSIERGAARDLINSTFGLATTLDDLDRLKCWNSGVIFGSARAIKKVASRWLELYQLLLTAPTGSAFVPNDQLCLWLTLREAAGDVKVGELPLRWNFMPGLALGVGPGTISITDDAFNDVSILHLAANKHDEWAKRRVMAALARADLPSFPAETGSEGSEMSPRNPSEDHLSRGSAT